MRGPIIMVVVTMAALGAIGSAPSIGRAAPSFDTVPDPQTLLNQAGQALVAASTVHFCATARSGSPVGDIALRLEGDEDFGAQAVRAQDGVSVGNGKADTESVIQIKSRHWYKSKYTANRWKKGRGSLRFSSLFSRDDPLGVQRAAQGSDVVRVTFETIGAETFSGVAVWHVRQTVTKTSSKGNPYDTRVDYLIGQTGEVPYQVSSVLNNSDDAISQQTTERNSHLGQHLAIKAPTVGSQKPLHGVTKSGSCAAP